MIRFYGNLLLFLRRVTINAKEECLLLTIHGGRVRRLWPELLKAVAAARQQDIRCLLLVPEQYTLQAERDLISGLHLPGFFDIEVLSLSRFVQRQFQQYSGGRARIDANGKNIAMARALLDTGKKLKYYTRAAQRRGFVGQSGEWIADMKRAEISPDQLTEYAAGLPEGAYQDKVSDLAALYTAYDAILAGKYVDGEDVLARAMEAIPQSGAVKDSDVFVYGFDMITDDFSRLLCTVTRCCRECHVYLVMDREEAPDGDCFKPVRDSAERLRAHLRQAGLRREWLWSAPTPLNAPEEIRYLEEKLLVPGPAPYDKSPAAITLYEAASPYAEAQEIAQQITLLLRRGVGAGDIFVLCGSLDTYGAVLEAVLGSYGIPFYLALKEPLQYHGLSQLLLTALRCVSGGYRREDVLALLKSGYAPLSEEECWLLENYAARYGINGARWHAPFTRGEEEERRVPEEARVKLIPLLKKLQDDLREAHTGAESLQAPMDFLISCGAYARLLEQENGLMEARMDAAALRARQVWSRLLTLFDQLHEIAGASRIPAKAMVNLLEAGLLENEISALPPTDGCVSVGLIGNLIPVEPRAVFVCGLDSSINEGHENGLLSPEEKDSICADLHAYLGMETDERDLMAELDVWKALCSPTEELHLSYAQASQGGAAQRPAAVVSAIRRLFPQMMVYGSVTDTESGLYPLAPLPALDEIGLRIRGGNLIGEWLKAWRWLMQSPAYRPMALELIRSMQDTAPEEHLPAALAKELFTERIVSVSRLESYAACPYSHFVEYGLRPQEQKEWGIDSRDRGNFFHAAMEGFTRTLPENPQWPHITRKECDSMMEAALRPLTALWDDSAMTDTARARAEARRYTNICKRVAWTFTKGATQSQFRPTEIEVAFGYPGGPPPLTLRLQDGSRVLVRGRIDRIDRFDSGESVYLRVVDYKSGEQKLDPAKIYVGMQLQLLLYLEAALQSDKGALPAGAFYQWMGDPLVDQSKKAAIETELARRLCLKGVMLSDVQVVEWMDSAKPPVSIEDVFKKDGTPRAGKLACTLEELDALIRRAHQTAVKLTEEIRRGGIQPSPVVDKSNVVRCQYCAFAGVCRRDSHQHTLDRPLPDVKLHDLTEEITPSP